MSSYDFIDYLQQRLNSDNEKKFSVETLTGGLTNHTARASFWEPVSSIGTTVLERDGVSYALKSVVLKNAPPFLAADPSWPMSTNRQLVEKRALQILAGNDIEFPETKRLGRGRHAKVHIPKLVWHDEESNVLWIEDLGKMNTLSEVLLVGDETDLQPNIEKVAVELGAFLFELYSTTSNPAASFIANMAKVSDQGGIYDFLVDAALTNLQGAGVEDAKILSERVRESLEKLDIADVSKCMGMGDFWPENILVDLGDRNKKSSIKCGLVDWEYFGVSDAPSELGMFLAHLHVHIANTTTSATVKQRIKRFTDIWLRFYIEVCVKNENVSWKPSNGFIRRLLLSYGRELVGGVDLYGNKVDGITKQRLLEGGIRSLRAAGGSSNDIDLSILKQEKDEVYLQDFWEGLSILVSV